MRTVIIDTNMLLVPGQFKVDIFSELERVLDEPYEIHILEGTMKELEKIATEGSGEDKRAAKLAKLLIKHHEKRCNDQDLRCKALKVVPISSQAYVDDAIVEIAEDGFVATNDRGLKHRLLEKGVRVIYLRQQQRLAIST